MPVTHGVTSSSLVRTANEALEIQFSKAFLVLGGTGSVVMPIFGTHGVCRRFNFAKPVDESFKGQQYYLFTIRHYTNRVQCMDQNVVHVSQMCLCIHISCSYHNSQQHICKKSNVILRLKSLIQNMMLCWNMNRFVHPHKMEPYSCEIQLTFYYRQVWLVNF